MAKDTEAMRVLQECVELMRKKSQDYQNPNSNVVQAMHYRRGIDTIHDIMQGKMYRAQSLLESGSNPSFESLEDTYKDLINYASFAVAWLRKKMEGQDKSRDIFNRRKELTPELLPMDQLFREVENELLQRVTTEDELYNRIQKNQKIHYENERLDDASQYC